MNCHTLYVLIFLIDTKILLNEETIKLNANDQTIILEIFPETIHCEPKIILKRFSPNRIIVVISTTEIKPTIYRTGFSSARKLSFWLNFSEILCNNTLDIEDAMRARGIESKSFERSKKPAVSGEKYLLIKIGGKR